MNKALYWDFFGPDAARTAEHFKRHLEAFLAQNGVSAEETGLCSAGSGHRAVYCRLDDGPREAVKRALRPRREE